MKKNQRGSREIWLFVRFVMILALINFVLPIGGNCQTVPSFKEQIEQRISLALGVPVVVGDYRLEYATVYLGDIKIGDSQNVKAPRVHIDKLQATCDLMALLGGNLVLNDISISSLTCLLTRDEKSGIFPKKNNSPETSSKKQKISDLPFLNLKGKELELKIFDTGTGKTLVFRIDEASLNREKAEETLAARFSGKFSMEKNPASANPELKSNLSGKLNFTGDLYDPKVQGTIRLSDLITLDSFLKKSVKVDDVTFAVSEEFVKTEKFTGTWGQSKFSISGQLRDFRKLLLSINYSVFPLVLDDLGAAFLAGDGLTVSGSGITEGTISGSISAFNLSGNLNQPSCAVAVPLGGSSKSKFIFPFKNLKANYSYSGKQIQIDKVSTEIFGGRLSGSGNVHPHGIPVKFDFSASGSGLRAEQFLSENSSQKNVVSGPMDATFSASGNTSGLTSWNGKGSLSMLNGHYQTPPVITPLLSLVNLSEFSSGKIESGKGTFALKNGVMATEDLVFITEAGKAYYRGRVGLDTTLDGQMNLIFSQEAVGKSNALKQISLDGKSVNVPSKVQGTLLSPVFPGFSAQKLLELGLKRKGQKMLNDILFPGRKDTSGSESTTDTPTKDSGKNVLQDLQNIFKFKQKPAAEEEKPATNQDNKQEKDSDVLKNQLKKIFKF